MPLLDVVRAAISEIEQYDRIAVNVQPGVVIAGRAASDLVHLAAELIENATAFSSAQVLVTAGMLNSGGALVEIIDEGLGIADEELARANWRLDHPPVIDVGVSRRMGLFVVGRLAARHGVRVRLKHAQPRGLSALVWLPESVAQFEAGRLAHRRGGPTPAPTRYRLARARSLRSPPRLPSPPREPRRRQVTRSGRAGSVAATGRAATFCTDLETGSIVSIPSGRPESLAADRRERSAVVCRSSSTGHAGVARTHRRLSGPMRSDADGTDTRGKPVSTAGYPAQDLNWLVTDFVGRVPDVAQAVIVSSDGLVVAVSAGSRKIGPSGWRR